MMKDNLIFSAIILMYFIGSSLATIDKGKRKRGDDEAGASSSAAAYGQVRTEVDSFQQIQEREFEFRMNAIDSVDKIYNFNLECSPEALKKLKDEEKSEDDVVNFIKKCDIKFELWLRDKISPLGQLGGLMLRWFSAISLNLDQGANYFQAMTNEEVRDIEDIAKRFRNTCFIRRHTKREAFTQETIDNSKRVFYLGDGICIYILAPPLDRVEKFMEVVLDEFRHLEYVQNLDRTFYTLESLLIYVFQKLCHKFVRHPRKFKLQNSEKGYYYPIEDISRSSESRVRDMFGKRLSNIEARQRENNYECNWRGWFLRKQLYQLLYRLVNDPNFVDLKKGADQTTDSFVKHCLIDLSSKEEIDLINERFEGSHWERSLPSALEKLRSVIESYELPLKQSINSALDVRSSTNKFRDALFSNVVSLIFDNPDVSIIKFFISLLSGQQEFEKVIFKKQPVNPERQLVEVRTLEFLSHIFSIEGYKPGFRSPLLDFYYLYKIVEICRTMPVGELIELDTTKASVLELIELTEAFEFECTPETLDKLFANSFPHQLTEYLRDCERQAEVWLLRKVGRLGNFGSVITHLLKSLGKYMEETTGNLQTLLDEEDMREDERFRKIREIWRHPEPKDSDGLPLEAETLETARGAYKYGDGICTHIQEPPFDRIEKFVAVVLMKLQHLEYVKFFNLCKHIKPDILRIYVLQKLCRKFYQKPLDTPISFALVDIERITSPVAARDALNQHSENIKIDEQHGYRCNSNGVFSRKQQYDILNSLKREKDFKKIKDKVDRSTDEFVGRCLKIMSSSTQIDNLYSKIQGTEVDSLLPIVINQLWLAMSVYQLPHDQSINEALNIRSPNNGFKSALLAQISELIIDTQNIHLVKHFANFLLGRFSSFTNGIFREPIYDNMNELIEFKVLEFLFHIFSIKGYRPGPSVTNPLLDFYYLYKVSEICLLVPVQ